MDRTPTVSVVVPTCRRADLLRETLASLHDSELHPLEVLVSSDDWSDGTDGVVKASGWTRIDTDRLGAAGHRNAGWMAARGEVIAFIDDDCQATPGWLGALLRPFSDPDVSIVQGRTVPARPVGPRERSVDIPNEYGLYETCNIAYRREALERAGGFDETFEQRFGGRPFGEDADLAWRLKRSGEQSTFAPDALVRHHVFSGGVRPALVEEWRRGYFPELVRLVPEVSSVFPGPRFLLREQSVRAQLLLAGVLVALAGRRPIIGAVLTVPYLRWARARFGAAGAAEHALYDLVSSFSLLVGSARARRLLL